MTVLARVRPRRARPPAVGDGRLDPGHPGLLLPRGGDLRGLEGPFGLLGYPGRLAGFPGLQGGSPSLCGPFLVPAGLLGARGFLGGPLRLPGGGLGLAGFPGLAVAPGGPHGLLAGLHALLDAAELGGALPLGPDLLGGGSLVLGGLAAHALGQEGPAVDARRGALGLEGGVGGPLPGEADAIDGAALAHADHPLAGLHTPIPDQEVAVRVVGVACEVVEGGEVGDGHPAREVADEGADEFDAGGGIELDGQGEHDAIGDAGVLAVPCLGLVEPGAGLAALRADRGRGHVLGDHGAAGGDPRDVGDVGPGGAGPVGRAADGAEAEGVDRHGPA